jgi:protein O-mannosyl-transferase
VLQRVIGYSSESLDIPFLVREFYEDRLASTATATVRQQFRNSGAPDVPAINGRRTVILSVLLALITFAAYSSVAHNGFTTLDDEVYILHNPHVQAGLKWETVKWAFTTFHSGNWHPVTWLSLALDCQVFGVNPVAIHFENVLIHSLNAVLLFLLLETCTGLAWPSLMVAALFAIHPINVESVAWAAERKNVLSMTFFLLAMLAYARYARRISVKRYVPVAVLFALGLMVKPEIITLPFVLLLWDYWPLRRMGGQGVGGAATQRSVRFLLIEKLPLLLLSLGSAIVTVIAARTSDAVRSGFNFARIGNALVAYARYLGKAFWPSHLAVMYIYRGHSIPAWAVVASAALLLGITGVVVYFRRHRYLVVGWFWFLGTLVPVIGVVAVGMQAMADRYAYLPFVGLFIAVVWSASEVAGWRGVPAAWVAAPSFVVLGALGFVTHHQISYWHDGETMWRRTLSVTERNTVAHDGLGFTFSEEGRVEDAIAEYKKVEELHGYGAPAIVQVGVYEQAHGHLRDGVEQYKLALAVAMDAGEQSDAYAHLGEALVEIGDLSNARLAYSYALRGNPENSLALMGSGLLAERADDLTVALELMGRALKAEPSGVNYLLFAQALRRAARLPEADAAEKQARKISPDFDQARKSAARELAAAGIGPQ